MCNDYAGNSRCLSTTMSNPGPRGPLSCMFEMVCFDTHDLNELMINRLMYNLQTCFPGNSVIKPGVLEQEHPWLKPAGCWLSTIRIRNRWSETCKRRQWPANPVPLCFTWAKACLCIGLRLKIVSQCLILWHHPEKSLNLGRIPWTLFLYIYFPHRSSMLKTEHLLSWQSQITSHPIRLANHRAAQPSSSMLPACSATRAAAAEAWAPEADLLWQDLHYIREKRRLWSQQGIFDGSVCFYDVCGWWCSCCLTAHITDVDIKITVNIKLSV